MMILFKKGYFYKIIIDIIRNCFLLLCKIPKIHCDDGKFTLIMYFLRKVLLKKKQSVLKYFCRFKICLTKYVCMFQS